MKDWNMIHKIKSLFDNGNGLSRRKIPIDANYQTAFIENKTDNIIVKLPKNQQHNYEYETNVGTHFFIL